MFINKNLNLLQALWVPFWLAHPVFGKIQHSCSEKIRSFRVVETEKLIFFPSAVSWQLFARHRKFGEIDPWWVIYQFRYPTSSSSVPSPRPDDDDESGGVRIFRRPPIAALEGRASEGWQCCRNTGSDSLWPAGNLIDSFRILILRKVFFFTEVQALIFWGVSVTSDCSKV